MNNELKRITRIIFYFCELHRKGHTGDIRKEKEMISSFKYVKFVLIRC